MSTENDELGLARKQHWVNQVARHAFERGDLPAIVFGDCRITWAELQQRVVAVSAALAERGVGRGDRVALLMGNQAEYIEIIIAANRIGAFAVPINFRLSVGEVAFTLDNSGSVVLFVDKQASASGIAAAAEAEGQVLVFQVGEGIDESAGGATPYDVLVAHPGSGAPIAVTEESEPALLMYTSGTTGRPKGAVLTHRNLAAQAATNVMAFRFETHDEVSLCAAPLFHIGTLGLVAPAILMGATMVILPSVSFDAGALLDVAERERVTSTFLVPTQWQAVCDEQERMPRDLSRLRVSSWGAAPASDTLLRRMDEVLPGASSLALFGQTEMSPVTCVLEAKDSRRKLGSVGRPAPGVWARIVDPDMVDVQPGEVGEIVYRGQGLMSGYWNNPEATARAFAGGWFHSGDLVRVDDEGFIYVVDRAKDMIISGGENIYCAEVENALAGHPDIAEVAVIGRAHATWGETPVAVVALKPGAADLTIEELRTWAGDRLARYKLPTDLVVVDSLPRNASGKVTKNVLRIPAATLPA
ncbi:fatty-acyl-CoA synthase [Rhodococcus sp. OK611]|uniref:long-chain-fatty-acid--CoA ligase n=1 Tax=unclassified Rhodococcus (in: high G+C Gram-positive bacteria) TaxID=192944 RepID=UPI000BD4470E|nr:MULTISPECIES: long-chain-fatty-acid--CoA ligase [unclassified Rhodococcus (in: high G+C Gram-positive bacteria)]PTR35947.1 fatty-acyl-CoA synthase [Rhodococcus sp. OK611]SNX94134.1 fatty-acyl-CoA synthase [Rhodococcus sp. OK270]